MAGLLLGIHAACGRIGFDAVSSGVLGADAGAEAPALLGDGGRAPTDSRASMSVSFSAHDTATVLSDEGRLDWVHWGLMRQDVVNRKRESVAPIGVSRIGDRPVDFYSNRARTFSWMGGTPTEAFTNARGGVSIVGIGSGFRVTVRAEAQPRTLKVYVGGYSVDAVFRARLDDPAGLPFEDASFSSVGEPGDDRLYTVTYSSAVPGRTLIVEWTIAKSLPGGNITFQAATLR